MKTEARSDPESVTDTKPSLDVIFEMLSNERRRKVCRYLVSVSETTTLGELAEHIAAEENGITEAELSYSERKRAYVSLYQVHLPKMADARVIEFDKDRKTVRAKSRTFVMYDCLVAVEERI